MKFTAHHVMIDHVMVDHDVIDHDVINVVKYILIKCKFDKQMISQLQVLQFYTESDYTVDMKNLRSLAQDESLYNRLLTYINKETLLVQCDHIDV